MHVKSAFMDGKFRIVDYFTGTIATKKNGKPWDNGGHVNATTAIQQATLINTGVEKDNTSAPGPTGKTGDRGVDGRGFTMKGKWKSDNYYSQNDVVYFEGSAYVWVNIRPGNAPIKEEGEYWNILVRQGNEGRPGASGGGARGSPGPGVPAGGTTGQVLKKKTNSDYETEWATDNTGSGGGSSIISSSALASITSNEADVTGDGTIYTVGSSGLTESYDVGSDLNASTAVFTAPEDGAYAIVYQFTVDGVQSKSYDANVVVTGDYSNSYKMSVEGLEPAGADNLPTKYRFTFNGVVRISESGTCKSTIQIGDNTESKASSVIASGSIISVTKIGSYS